MFLLLQVLVNCGLAAVSNASRKFENVAADNKKLKPFCMQFKKDEAKPEIRKKSEGRSPKGAGSAVRSGSSDSSHSLEPASQRPTGSDFGFRVSAFGFPSCPIPLKTAKNQDQ